MKRVTPWLQILGIGAFLLSLQLLAVYAASTAVMYVNPASQTLSQGNTTTIGIRIDSQKAYYIGYVKAYLTFPPNLLMVTHMDASDSYFTNNTELTYDNSAGTIHIQSTGTPYGSGNQLIARVTFKAKQPGSATIAFTSQSQASYYSYSKNELTGTTPGVITIPGSSSPSSSQTTASTSSPSQSSTVSSGTYASSPASANPTIATANNSQGLASESPTAQDIRHTHVVLLWQTTVASTAQIKYGLDPTQLDNVQAITQKQTDFNTVLSNLTPGRRYYYSVVITADGGLTANYSGEFVTLGFPLEITVVGQAQKPIANAEVSAGGITQKTTESGKTRFYASAGSATFSVKVGKTKKDFPLNVQALPLPPDDSDPIAQSFRIQMPVAQHVPLIGSLGDWVILLFGAITSVGLFLLLHGRYRRHHSKDKNGILSRSSIAHIDDRFIKKVRMDKRPSAEPQAASPSSSLMGAPAAKKPVDPPAREPSHETSLHPHTTGVTIQPIKHTPPQPDPPPPQEQEPAVKAPPQPTVHKEDGEPKDMFEMAEERFEQDERLKRFREKP